MHNLKFVCPEKTNQEIWDMGLKILEEITGRPKCDCHFSQLMKQQGEWKALDCVPHIKDINVDKERKMAHVCKMLWFPCKKELAQRKWS